MKNILVILGTRPEIIKLFPVIMVLKGMHYNVFLCNTGQQKELTTQTLELFNLVPDYELSVMTSNQTLPSTQARILKELEKIEIERFCDAVIVQGDTLTAFCGALIGFYSHKPVFHVEAGLRTYDISEPFPEEAYRKMITSIATFNFAPSLQAQQNLIREGVQESDILVSGNTIIDTLNYCKKHLNCCCANKFKMSNNILITVHRRENHDKLRDILSAIKELSVSYPKFTYIVVLHPNPNVKFVIQKELSNLNNVILVNPLTYFDMIALMLKSVLILTDSGGIQEEAAYLGIQTVILREKTERQEILQFPYVHLVGTDSNVIYKTVESILSNLHKFEISKNKVYGNGDASIKIANKINELLQ